MRNEESGAWTGIKVENIRVNNTATSASRDKKDGFEVRVVELGRGGRG
jgi:hypothetical protein